MIVTMLRLRNIACKDIEFCILAFISKKVPGRKESSPVPYLQKRKNLTDYAKLEKKSV